jgi:hypothetical protein
MKTWIVIISLLLLPGSGILGIGGGFDHPVVIKWLVEPNCTMQILGRSNVNEFCCSIKGFKHCDTLVYSSKDQAQPGIFSGKMVVDIKGFDCKHRFITSDLRKTLKADDNPNMSIRFLTLERIPSATGSPSVKGLVEIELAGIKKKYEVSYRMEQETDGHWLLTGTKTVLFSDFKLCAPSRIAGLIRIEEQIGVQFQLHLKHLA